MRTAAMAMKPLADAPPSSPEFIIKKPHDEARHRPKQWRSLATDSTRRPTRMNASQGAAKRVTRTYSKRENTTSTPAAERPAKRQRTESTEQRTESTENLPLLPPAAPPKPVKKAPSTIDRYFFSSASSSTRSSGPSSDCAWSRDEASPPSSPPARRWTSPRKLKFRPSLLPIGGGEGGQGGMKAGKRKRDDGEGDGYAECLGRVRRRRLSGEIGADVSADEERGAASGEPGVIRTRPGSSTKLHGDGDGGPGSAPYPSSSARLDSGSRSGANAAKGAPATSQDPTPDNHARPLPSSTAASNHDAAKPDTVPTYTMPYKFYLANPDPPARPPPATTKKPARTVQTTLNLSTKQPFKECKLCDTVFNPLLAGDVKLHQLRHARVLGEGDKKRRRRGGRGG